MTTRILIVDDHRMVRAGFRELLEENPNFEVIGEADDGDEGIKLAEKLQPNVILMDIDLRGSAITGINATKRILANHPHIKIIAVSMWADAPHVKGMIGAGAVGYVSKSCSEDELLSAVSTVMTGKHAFSDEITQIIQDAFVQSIQSPNLNNPNDLSNREMEVLRLTALGENSKTIADKLGISSKTVDAHRNNTMNKLKLYSIAELTRFAIREKIIHPDE